MSKQRTTRYLERQYQDLSNKKQKEELQKIISRLNNINFLDGETLESVVQSLQDEENWPLWKILAHLDMICLLYTSPSPRD